MTHRQGWEFNNNYDINMVIQAGLYDRVWRLTNRIEEASIMICDQPEIHTDEVLDWAIEVLSR